MEEFFSDNPGPVRTQSSVSEEAVPWGVFLQCMLSFLGGGGVGSTQIVAAGCDCLELDGDDRSGAC